VASSVAYAVTLWVSSASTASSTTSGRRDTARASNASGSPASSPPIEPAGASASEAGIYPSDRPPANIMKAMSLVPDEVRSFFDLVTHQYLPGAVMRDFSREYRAISHAQIELLAARVSALNQCLY